MAKNDKTGILCVTGHRPEKLHGYGLDAQKDLARFAHKVLQRHQPVRVITGMAQGWDQAVAEACIALRVPFIAAIPFRGQDALWPPISRRRYQDLLEKATHVHVVSQGGYSADKMQKRNEWMVDHSSSIVALWNGTVGGTKNCVQYAMRAGIRIFNVWDEFVKDLGEPR